MSAFNKDYTYGGTFTYGGTGVYGGLRPQERIAGLDSTHIKRENDGGLAITANLQSGVATNPDGLKYDSVQNYDGNYPYDVSFMSGKSAPVDINVVFTGVDGVDII